MPSGNTPPQHHTGSYSRMPARQCPCKFRMVDGPEQPVMLCNRARHHTTRTSDRRRNRPQGSLRAAAQPRQLAAAPRPAGIADKTDFYTAHVLGTWRTQKKRICLPVGICHAGSAKPRRAQGAGQLAGLVNGLSCPAQARGLKLCRGAHILLFHLNCRITLGAAETI